MNKKKKTLKEYKKAKENIKNIISLLGVSVIIPVGFFLALPNFFVGALVILLAQFITASLLFERESYIDDKIAKLEYKKEYNKINNKQVKEVKPKKEIIKEEKTKDAFEDFDKLSKEEQIELLKKCRSAIKENVVYTNERAKALIK